MSLIEIIILIMVVFICTYALVDRIMNCIEYCAQQKAFGNVMSSKGEVAKHVEKELNQE